MLCSYLLERSSHRRPSSCRTQFWLFAAWVTGGMPVSYTSGYYVRWGVYVSEMADAYYRSLSTYGLQCRDVPTGRLRQSACKPRGFAEALNVAQEEGSTPGGLSGVAVPIYQRDICQYSAVIDA